MKKRMALLCLIGCMLLLPACGTGGAENRQDHLSSMSQGTASEVSILSAVANSDNHYFLGRSAAQERDDDDVDRYTLYRQDDDGAYTPIYIFEGVPISLTAYKGKIYYVLYDYLLCLEDLDTEPTRKAIVDHVANNEYRLGRIKAIAKDQIYLSAKKWFSDDDEEDPVFLRMDLDGSNLKEILEEEIPE